VDAGVGDGDVVLVGDVGARSCPRSPSGAVRHRAGRDRRGPAVRLPTYLVDADPETLRADEAVQVTFRPL
jgi:hypothetical protein